MPSKLTEPALGHYRQEGDLVGRVDAIFDGDDHRAAARIDRNGGFGFVELAQRGEVEVFDFGEPERQRDDHRGGLDDRGQHQRATDSMIFGDDAP